MRCALMNTPCVYTRMNNVPSILLPFTTTIISFAISIFLIAYKMEVTKDVIHVMVDRYALLCSDLCPASDVEK